MTTSVTSTPPYATTGLEPADVNKDFRSGTHALDDYFARHAIANDRAGIARTYVLRRAADDREELPEIIGFYTRSAWRAFRRRKWRRPWGRSCLATRCRSR